MYMYMLYPKHTPNTVQLAALALGGSSDQPQGANVELNER